MLVNSLTVCAPNQCTGCMACMNACTQNAILVKDDIEACNAYIDSTKCISCNMCHNVCPQIKNTELIEPVAWYQGWASDENERAKSSSGGFATAIAKAFAKRGGVVCGCVGNHEKFGFEFAFTAEECNKFRGSKYVKSYPGLIYREVITFLRNGREVLFIGLPCQVAGLKNIVGEKLGVNLYTIDLICHGSPSPQLLDLYLKQSLKKSHYSFDNLKFRINNRFGLYSGENKILPDKIQDSYTMAFLDGFVYTKNCYTCKFANVKRVSDVSLGDSWGSLLGNAEMRKGISLALCQTAKGLSLINNSGLTLFSVDEDRAIASNRQLREPSSDSRDRERFFKTLKRKGHFEIAVFSIKPIKIIKQKVKGILHIVGLL